MAPATGGRMSVIRATFESGVRLGKTGGERRRGYYVVAKLQRALNRVGKCLNGSKILVLGVTYKADVADETQVNAAIEAAFRTLGSIDILINNAAHLDAAAPVAQMSARSWRDEIATNLNGAFFCCRAVLPGMMDRRSGTIINIASVAGQRAYPLRSAYAVSKAGLIALTRTLAAEVGSYNVRVNAIAPGPVSGNRMKRVIEERARSTGQSIAGVEASYLNALALGRMVEEEDVARMALFLASREGDNITGQVFNVCSGYKID